MIANQTLVASDGYEVALFPMPYLYMSQDEGGDYSHQGTYNIDLLGWGANGRIYRAPLYAPVNMKLVDYKAGTDWGNTCVFESVSIVHMPNGYIDWLCMAVGHDSNPPITTVGTTVNQGQLCYHTGTYGHVTGDHVHLCMGLGHYQGFTRRSTGNYDLTNRIHAWDGLYVNDTVISQGYNHNWRTWDGPTPPVPPVPGVRHNGFPWVLYARRLNQKRNNMI